MCGSTQGIGKACALKLAESGAHVTLVARDAKHLTEILGQMNTSCGQKHAFIAADFKDHLSVKEKIRAYARSTADIRILINNTGGAAPGQLMDATADDFLDSFSAHLLCNHHLAQALVPCMKEARYGRIINIVSTSVKAPIPGLGVSNTIRCAVAAWAKTLAGELALFGITVNNVLPGMTMTNRLEKILWERADREKIPFEKCEKSAREQIPARRFANPEEIASAVTFLASPDASYINGVSLPVDGGSTPVL